MRWLIHRAISARPWVKEERKREIVAAKRRAIAEENAAAGVRAAAAEELAAVMKATGDHRMGELVSRETYGRACQIPPAIPSLHCRPLLLDFNRIT
jgi:hypothetical protein